MSKSSIVMKTPPSNSRSRIKRIGTVAVVAAFLLPAAIAFVFKFFEFMQSLGTDELGAIALVPMLNYLAVAAGFLCLLAWAILGGMFRDVERPKFKLLENEEMLNAADAHKETSS